MNAGKSMAEEVLLDNQTQPSAGNAETGVVKIEGLIRQLEKSGGPDRGLDNQICQAIGRGVTTFPQYEPDGVAPRYTASIDAALTLVPDFINRRWYVADSDDRSAGKPVATVYHPADCLNGSIPRSVGATPAIALCIAALKARAALSTTSAILISPEQETR